MGDTDCNFRLLPAISIKLSGRKYKLYVAFSSEQKQKGLSGVFDLGDQEGMLFPYADEKPLTFQFKETLMPLKIYFINRKGKIVHSSCTKPGQIDNVVCAEPAKWVIEVLDEDSYYAG